MATYARSSAGTSSSRQWPAFAIPCPPTSRHRWASPSAIMANRAQSRCWGPPTTCRRPSAPLIRRGCAATLPRSRQPSLPSELRANRLTAFSPVAGWPGTTATLTASRTKRVKTTPTSSSAVRRASPGKIFGRSTRTSDRAGELGLFEGLGPGTAGIQQHRHAVHGEGAVGVLRWAAADGGLRVAARPELLHQVPGQLAQIGILPAHHEGWRRVDGSGRQAMIDRACGSRKGRMLPNRYAAAPYQAGHG